MYIEEAAFPSLTSLIKGKLTVPLNQPLPDLATLSAQNFAIYKPCIQSSHYRIKVIFSLFYNTAVSEPLYYKVEVVMPSSDSKALIDIIYNE